MRRLCVFCGSSDRVAPVYREAAEGLGRLLAARGITLVFGGGRIGLMGAIADAALAAGGEVLGVIPERLVEREVAHHGVTELFVVQGMHGRKKMMAQLSDAFVALPGGLGTLEELFEVLTWSQLGIHRKRAGILDVDGYYGPLMRFIDQAVEVGFVRPEHRGLLLYDDDPERLLARLDGGAPG